MCLNWINQSVKMPWQGIAGLSTPPGHQILRIDRREMKDDVISHDKWRHLCQKCSLIPIDVYSTSFSTLWLKLQWRTRIYGETFRVTVAQTTQNIWKLMVGKSSVQEIATLAIIREISDSNLETGRYSPKSGVFRIIRESWQHCMGVARSGLWAPIDYN